MFKCRYVGLLVMGALLAMSGSRASEVHYYQDNGVTYRETRRTVDRPIVDVRMQEHSETVYRYELKTETRESVSNACVPVTTYYLEPRVHGWWNPLKPNTIVHHWVPRTNWQWHSQKVNIPVTTGRWVPETRVVQRPERTLRMEPRDEVNRVVVRDRPAWQAAVPTYTAPAASRTAARPRVFGGLHRLESDPPRFGTRGSAASDSFLR